MKHAAAEILREYGPFPGDVGGVSFDGANVWFAADGRINALDPDSGAITGRLDVPADAGTAFDGTHLWQIAETMIRKVDPATGEVLGSIPAPGNGGDSGLTWAEGSLWVGEYRAGRIHRIDPETGAIQRTIQSDRFVTGVTWVDGELWHATWQDDESGLRRIDPASGKVLEQLDMPAGTGISGLESDGAGRFFCGGGGSGKVRAVRRPGYARAA
jgi:glutamine cyclotransferase